MRNLKKLLAVIITVAMLATLMVPAFAEENSLSAAEICAKLGMLRGTTGEVTDEYLASDLSRHQMAIMFLRLRGLEEEANAFDGTDNFDDADEIKYAEGRAVMAYLKAHPELGFVGSEGKFMPLKNVEAQEYFKVMLVALGYKQGEDFEWADVLSFAAEHGLPSAANYENKQYLTPADVAEITVEALKAEDAEGNILVEKLIALGAIDEEVAIEVGLIAPEEEEAKSATAAATGAKKFTVTFDGAVDESKVSFSVKKGSVTSNIKSVTFAEDKTSADLEMASKLTAGTYTITVKGLGEDIVIDVEVEDEKVDDIVFTSDIAPIVRESNSQKISIGYKVLNQYGEDISNSVSVKVYPGKGSVEGGSDTVSGGSIVLESGAGFAVNEKVSLALIYADGANYKYVANEFTVGAESRVSEIAMTSIYNPNNKELVEGVGENFYIVVVAKDQYGNVMDNDEWIEEDVLVTVNNTNVADVARTTSGGSNPEIEPQGDNKTTMQVTINGAGKTTVRLMAIATGKTSTFDIEVKESAKVDVFTMSQPDLFAAGDKNIEIPFTAVDQYGNEVTSGLQGKVTINPPQGFAYEFKKDYVTGKEKLLLSDNRQNPTAGTVLVTATTGTQKFVTLTINVKEKAVPTVIEGIKDFATVYAKGATATFGLANIVVHDQYGREIELPDGYKVIAETSDAGKVAISGTDGVIDANTSKTVTGVAKGTATITLKLYNGSNEVKNSDYTFSVRTVEKDEIADYELADLGTTYHDRNYGGDKKYDVALTVYGLMADGSKVVIPNTSDYINVIINDQYVGYDSTAGTVYSVYGRDFGSATSVEVPVIVHVFGAEGPVVRTKTLTVSNVAPAITTLEVAGGTITTKIDENFVTVSKDDLEGEENTVLEALVKDAVKAIDQYGKELTGTQEVYTYMVATNLPSGRNDITEVAAGETFSVLAITDNGKTVTFKVLVTD